MLILLLVAVFATAIWSFLDRKRPSYEVLFRWNRLVLRVTFAIALLRYGFIKVFPIQFPAPALAVLNEPVGNASPTMLFWTVYGFHPAFEMLLGWIEVTAGLLLFFRRSSFAEAVLAFRSVANVVLLNCTFDVPVKLYSLSLVALSTALLAPELGQLGSFSHHSRSWYPRPLGALAGEPSSPFDAVGSGTTSRHPCLLAVLHRNTQRLGDENSSNEYSCCYHRALEN